MSRADRLKQWVADGCPDDAFFRAEAARGRLVELGLPTWWATVRLMPRPDPKAKGKRR